MVYKPTNTVWWFGTMEFYDFPYIGNVIIPTDELIFFRGVGQPPTSNDKEKPTGPRFNLSQRTLLLWWAATLGNVNLGSFQTTSWPVGGYQLFLVQLALINQETLLISG